ncbi:hypothetical protein ACR0ST_04695 [Aliidiomarina sp. Khilg15.8]
MTTTSDITYTRLLQMASGELQAGNYPAAEKLLHQCMHLATPSPHYSWADTDLLNYCKATILLAATKLRMHQRASALHDFSHALSRLHRLYSSAQSAESQATIRRYQAVLIRANQTACTLSRITNSVEVLRHDKTIRQPLPH